MGRPRGAGAAVFLPFSGNQGRGGSAVFGVPSLPLTPAGGGRTVSDQDLRKGNPVPMTVEEKIVQLEKLLEMDPDPTGYFMLGKLYLDVARHGDAAAALEKSLELKPGYSAAWRLAGDAHRKAGDKDKAARTYRKGIEVAEANGDLQTVKEMKAFLAKLEQE